MKSSLNFIINYHFRQMGIVIPFPQHDLWLRNPETLVRSREKVDTPQTSPPPSQPTKPLSVRDLLKKVPYFRNCSDFHLRQLIEMGYRRSLAANEIVFHKGEEGTAFYIILSGSVETIVAELDKHVKTSNTGEIFGEVALMLGTPYSTSSRTLEETILFTIDKHNFEKLLHLNPDFTELIAQEFAKDKKIYSQVREELQELGLLDMSENHQTALVWIRTRLKKLFHLQ